MFPFVKLYRKFSNNVALSNYCVESTNNSMKKLTEEFNEERRFKQGILVKRTLNNLNNDSNGDDDNNKAIIITIISLLSSFYFAHRFLLCNK